MSKVSPISAGLASRWASAVLVRKPIYLKFKPACEACGQDFTIADTADGPAFFVGFIVLILFGPFGFLIPMANLPIWVRVLLMIGLAIVTLIASLIMLPKAKSLLMALQISHKAEEARFEKKDG